MKRPSSLQLQILVMMWSGARLLAPASAYGTGIGKAFLTGLNRQRVSSATIKAMGPWLKRRVWRLNYMGATWPTGYEWLLTEAGRLEADQAVKGEK